MADADTPRAGWKRLLPRDPWQIIIGPIIVLLVGAGITVLTTRGKGASRNTKLQTLPPIVDNPLLKYRNFVLSSGPNKGWSAAQQTEASKARIEIRLHNLGAQRSVLTSAKFTIERLAIIRPCGQGASLPVTGRYDVSLPEQAGPTVEVPIDQQIGPDQADRFTFRIISQAYFQRHTADVLVYQLRVSVMHDDSPSPLDVGEVVVAVPGVPTIMRPAYFAVPGRATCVPAPPATQRIAASFLGARSAELARFLDFLRAAT